MRKYLLIYGLILVSSCTTNPLLVPSKHMVDGPLKELKTKYIPNDASLTAEEKKLRLDAIKSYEELIQAASEEK